MPPKTARNSQRVRQEVAFEAARILATEGQRNYRMAKEKAAARLGLSARAGLPSNSEVETELKRYQAMYGGAEHGENLVRLRRAAIGAMRFFKNFRPKLVGPVLDGTADQHSRISLHLFCENDEDVLAFLHRNGIAFEQERRRIRWHDGGFRDMELLVIEADGATFELALMTGKSWKQPPPDPIDGGAQRRAGLSEVETLLATA